MVKTMGVGVSRSENSERAITESIAAATRHFENEPDLVLSWVTEGYDRRQVAETASRCAPVTCGCSAWGAVTPEGVLTRGIATIALQTDRPVIGPVVGPLDAGDHLGSGHRLGRTLLGEDIHSRLGLGIVYSNSSEHGHEFVAGFYGAVGPGFPLFGCATWDTASNRYVYSNGRLVEHGALAIALGAVERIESVVRHGWTPLSPPALATRAADGELLLDGKPAWEVYADLLPADRTDLRSDGVDRAGRTVAERLQRLGLEFPLGTPTYSGQYVVHDAEFVPGQDRPVCRSAVFEGSLVRIMQITAEDLLNAAGEAASVCRGPAGLAGVLGTTCLTRLMFYDGGYEAERKVLEAEIGKQGPFAVLPAFGEIGSFEGGPASHFNKTFILVPLRSGGE